MEKVIINSYEEFEKLVGQQIGVSDYVELSQERINLFADATLDHQWIHVDTERDKSRQSVSQYDCSRLSDAFHASLPVESDYSGEQSENDDQLRDG